MAQFERYAGMYNSTVKLSGTQGKYCRAIASLSGPVRTVLDVGGGTGAIAACFAAGAEKVVVLDPSREMLSRIKDSRIEAVKGVAQKIPFPDRSFDLVFCVDALHHFSNDHGNPEEAIHKAIGEMLRVLKPQGILVIIDFDTGRILGRLAAFFEKRLMGWDNLFFSKKGIQALFRRYPVSVEVSKLDMVTYIARVRKASP
jgi:ubiquinone/menaquinone biosynthesis C-methylase UbiE